MLVDGGMVRFLVIDKNCPAVDCHCIDPGLSLPHANLTVWRVGNCVEELNAVLPTISSKDWQDIDFGMLRVLILLQYLSSNLLKLLLI